MHKGQQGETSGVHDGDDGENDTGKDEWGGMTMASKGRAARVGARAMVTAAARSAAAMLPLMGIAATAIKHGSAVNCSSNDHHYSRSNSTLSP